MSALWKENEGVKVWQLERPCDSFRMIYDKIQDQLQSIACMDTLLSGKCNMCMQASSLTEHCIEITQVC